MSRESITLRGRAAAEAGMVDACTITRLISAATDPNTAVVTETVETIYTGKCRFKPPKLAGKREVVAESSVVLVGYELQLPMSATGVLVDDRVEATASLLDPDLPGHEFFVASPAAGTHLTARRLHLREVDS